MRPVVRIGAFAWRLSRVFIMIRNQRKKNIPEWMAWCRVKNMTVHLTECVGNCVTQCNNHSLIFLILCCKEGKSRKLQIGRRTKARIQKQTKGCKWEILHHKSGRMHPKDGECQMCQPQRNPGRISMSAAGRIKIQHAFFQKSKVMAIMRLLQFIKKRSDKFQE